jgi:hypothetical protein
MCMSTTYAQNAHSKVTAPQYRQKAEPASLSQLMRQAAQELKLLSAEVNLVEREIEEFNQFYYAEVGTLYEEYKKIARTEEANDYLDDVTKVEKTDSVIASLSKKIFRRVAKICHPDTNEATAKSDFFVKLSDAYKAQDLGGLLLLEQHLHKNSKTQTKHFLEEQLDMMEHAKEALDKRKVELVNSPAYKLRQKIFWAKMGGQDLIAQIKRHLERQIATIRFAV